MLYAKQVFIMANLILNKLIAHSIINLAERQVGFGKTKLVKLLYLIDVEITAAAERFRALRLRY